MSVTEKARPGAAAAGDRAGEECCGEPAPPDPGFDPPEVSQGVSRLRIARADLRELHVEQFRVGVPLRRGMLPLERQHLVHLLAGEALGDAHPVLEVTQQLKRIVEGADLLPDAATEEHRRLGKEGVAPEIREPKRRMEIELEVAVLPQHQQVAEDEARVRVRPQRLDRGLDRPREIGVVGVEVGQDLALRLREALVDRVVHPAVGARGPA